MRLKFQAEIESVKSPGSNNDALAASCDLHYPQSPVTAASLSLGRLSGPGAAEVVNGSSKLGAHIRALPAGRSSSSSSEGKGSGAGSGAVSGRLDVSQSWP